MAVRPLGPPAREAFQEHPACRRLPGPAETKAGAAAGALAGAAGEAGAGGAIATAIGTGETGTGSGAAAAAVRAAVGSAAAVGFRGRAWRQRCRPLGPWGSGPWVTRVLDPWVTPWASCRGSCPA